ncbi:SdpI family protein [Rhodococcus sp. OK302]|uniref:SdpI family protein n=1 Tax=Rhodococcus sp. OK302 TaxID=1882769 RepID=UPI000B93CB41|nr:SdpI family protein [Rhodococcus sp. OK302]OYD67370.1 SdpI/YhfL family protein [Rhodococcus sp. OK302]
MVIVAVVLFVLALAVGGVAVAGLIGKLPRNRWAGVRTPDTLRSEESFALANKVAGPTMAAAAGLLVIGGIAALTMNVAMGLGIALVAVVAALFTAGSGGAIGARAAAAMPEPSGCGNDCNCGHTDSATADQTPVAKAEASAKEAASECGESSCGACSLKGACLPAK